MRPIGQTFTHAKDHTMAGRHRRVTRRTGTVGTLILAVLALGGGAATASSGVPDIRDCAKAQETARAERAQATEADGKASAAEVREAEAKEALAAYDRTHGGTDQPPNNPVVRDQLVTDVAHTHELAVEARAEADTQDSEAAAADRAADAACVVPAGAPGADGLNTEIVLADGVCAQAVIRPDPDRLVRVLTLIPCPPEAPEAPPAPPQSGDPVVVIHKFVPAPAPTPIRADLPVTH